MRHFYRLVENDPATPEQFASYYELGVTPPGASGRELHLSKGVSMFETEDQARQASPTMRKRADDLLFWVVRPRPPARPEIALSAFAGRSMVVEFIRRY